MSRKSAGNQDHAGACATSRQLAALPTISHELLYLIDGAHRCVDDAQRSLSATANQANPSSHEAQHCMLDRLQAAASALDRMALLAKAVASGKGSVVESCSIVEAILHTAAAARPLADERGVALHIECSPRLVLTPAGPIYGVIANALRNAIEASAQGGVVTLIAELATPESGKATVELDVFDTGHQPLPDPEQAFAPGFTTKPGAAGVGLALSLELITELNGTIALLPRADAKPGAHLKVRYPAPGDMAAFV